MAAVWESYKPRLREHALSKLSSDSWQSADIGTGRILDQTVEAIEIQDAGKNLTNNLVFWQNRYGHANRDHRALLEAQSNPSLRNALEQALFDHFRADRAEGESFEQIAELIGRKYPLTAYLFFLRDSAKYMPIQPTGFDRAFDALGIDFQTLRQCNWSNYETYNAILQGLRPSIAKAANLSNVRLVDAHSFCWIYSTLLKQELEGSLLPKPGASGTGHIIGGRQKSIIAMRYSVEDTAKNSNGQRVERVVKNKDLRMTSSQLEEYIAALLDLQDNKCALTGIPLQFHGDGADPNLLPSVDRIDSNGHYETGNLQVVCRFINFWKSDSENDEFRRLLMLVRGEEH
ncbi:hypothetical protein [Novosphingopyxis baekryungensis]|uniref:hypothetical protein n=1 Tax=Novosphingopyxis baekryungensis TaxID=279369 RepID=UPI0004155836|nr:hypothetical protein [Novosphingopyxis baekryungensis]